MGACRKWVAGLGDSLRRPRIRRPLLNTADEAVMRMAATLLTHPFSYCLKPDNRERLIEACRKDAGVVRLVGLLQRAQEAFADDLPLGGREAIWSKRESIVAPMGIATAVDLKRADADALHLEVQSVLNTRIMEGLVDSADPAVETTASDEALRLAAACIWLSDHLSLIVLGIARCRMHGRERLVVEPAGKQARQHLRRLWFGSAFDTMSLEKASASFMMLAIEMLNPARNQENLQKAFASALWVFPQQWRLSFDDGPVQALLEDYLRPLVRILSNVIIAKHTGRSLWRSDAEMLKAEKVFDLVFDMQRSLSPVDRLFDIADNGLVLGTRALGPGVLAIAEHMADRVLGADWHSDASRFQKADLFERLSGVGHLHILDVELLQHDTKDNVALDVDFFVRDFRHRKIYAVQLKHFETSDKGGILHWVARLRTPKSKLGKAITQLMHLPELLRTDAGIRAKLNRIGIATAEFQDIVPIVVHNVGPLDFWEVQSGVLLHDMLTFCSVLKGRTAAWIGKVEDEVVIGGREGLPDGPSLHESDRVIASYLKDPLFAQRLAGFDLAADVTRSLNFDGVSVSAKGLGV